MTSTQPDAAPALCRIALLVGDDMAIDYTLPAAVALIAVTEDIISGVNEKLRRHGRPELTPEHRYQLCRADAHPLDPQKTLDECGVIDGDQLWLLPAAATEIYEEVTETVSTAIARRAKSAFATVTADTARAVAGWLTAGTVGWACLIIVNWWWVTGGLNGPRGWLGPLTCWSMTLALAATARGLSTAADEQRRRSSEGLAWSALIPAAGGAMVSVPGTPGTWHIAAAIAAVIAGVAILGTLTGRHIVAVSAILTCGGFALAFAIVAASPWEVRAERVAVVALAAVIVLVTLATNIGVVASGVPTPLFPSVTNRGVFETLPGQPSDTVSPVGPTGLQKGEDIEAWARRGNQTITGLLLGAGVAAVIAARYAVVPGQDGGWRYTAFTAAVCAILALRARSFVDRYQSVALTVTAVASIAMVLGRFAAFDATNPATAMLCAALTLATTVLALVAALVVPQRYFSAPLRKAVEASEYLLLVVLLPWALWLLDLYPLIRNAVRHGL